MSGDQDFALRFAVVVIDMAEPVDCRVKDDQINPDGHCAGQCNLFDAVGDKPINNLPGIAPDDIDGFVGWVINVSRPAIS